MKQDSIVEILLVEDRAEDAELTMRALRRGKINNPVHVVHDGREALDFIFGKPDDELSRRNIPSLILLDLQMPEVGGFEVVKRLKADAATAHIPIIVLTGSAAHRDMIQSYNLEVNSYLIKPVNIRSFMEVAAQVGMSWTLTTAVSV